MLAPISFILPPGQCLGLVGDNGSGKSTLLRLIAQIERPDDGDVLFDGRSVLGNRQFLRRCMGYVPQRAELVTDLTVRQQLVLWQRACDVSGSISEEILRLLGLDGLLSKPIRILSGGMTQRVSIAMALIAHPALLLMDEVTAGLDGDYASRLLDWIELYMDQGGSVIWCSHIKDEIDRICGAVLHLESGRLL